MKYIALPTENRTNHRLLRALLLCSTTLVSGCLFSNRPLLPTDTIKERTPLETGWYLRTDIYNRSTNKRWAVDPEPVYFRKTGTTYDYYVDSGKLESRFQLFSSNPKDVVFIAQTKTGESEWRYAKTALHNGKFYLFERQCEDLDDGAHQTMMRLGKMGPYKNRKCEVGDPATLEALFEKDEWFPQAKLSYFDPVPDKQVVNMDQLATPPQTLPCKDTLTQTYDSRFPGKVHEGTELRRQVISVTRKPDATIQFGLTIEAKGNNYLNWAMIGFADNNAVVGCTPYYLIEFKELEPQQLVAIPSASASAIASTCQKVSPASPCGTLADMVKRYPGRVLVQGRQLHIFPGGAVTYGDLLTVVGERGISPLIVLRTSSSGMTRESMAQGV